MCWGREEALIVRLMAASGTGWARYVAWARARFEEEKALDIWGETRYWGEPLCGHHAKHQWMAAECWLDWEENGSISWLTTGNLRAPWCWWKAENPPTTPPYRWEEAGHQLSPLCGWKIQWKMPHKLTSLHVWPARRFEGDGSCALLLLGWSLPGHFGK